MRAAIILLSCLAYGSYAHRVQTTAERAQRSGQENQDDLPTDLSSQKHAKERHGYQQTEALGKLLLMLNPPAAWSGGASFIKGKRRQADIQLNDIMPEKKPQYVGNDAAKSVVDEFNRQIIEQKRAREEAEAMAARVKELDEREPELNKLIEEMEKERELQLPTYRYSDLEDNKVESTEEPLPQGNVFLRFAPPVLVLYTIGSQLALKFGLVDKYLSGGDTGDPVAALNAWAESINSIQ